MNFLHGFVFKCLHFQLILLIIIQKKKNFKSQLKILSIPTQEVRKKVVWYFYHLFNDFMNPA